MANPINVVYNSQRDNANIRGLRGSSQCGYTSASMMLSAFLPDASTDEFVASLIDRMEPKYGAASMADMILDKIPWARGMRLGMFGDAYAVVCQKILEERGATAKIQWHPTGGTPEQLAAAIDQGSPAMLSTMITNSGHYICVVGYDSDHWICHDPWGNALSGYRNQNGAFVQYPRDWLETRARKSAPDKKSLRFMYIKAG